MNGTASQDFDDQSRRQEAYSLAMKVQDRIDREWLPYLSEGEMKLLSFVRGQTLSRGKLSGHYTVNQVLNGVPKTDGSGWWGVGTGMSESSFHRARKSLISSGLMKIKSGNSGGYHFQINPDWQPEAVNVIHEGNVAMLKAPVHTKKQSRKPSLRAAMAAENDREECPDEAIDTVKLTVEHCQIDSHPNTDLFLDQTQSLTTFETTGAAPLAVVSEIEIPKVTEQRSGPRVVVRPKGSATPVNAELPSRSNNSSQRNSTKADSTNFEQTWKAAWKEAQAAGSIPEARVPAPWSTVDKKIVATVAREWRTMTNGTFHDFVEFCVQQWGPILRAKFAWMTESPPPTQPDLRFLCNGKFLKRFIEAFSDQEAVKWIGTMDGTAREIQRAIASGMTPEAAKQHVATSQALEIDRHRRDKDIATAKRALQTAELVRESARKEAVTREKYRPENRQPKVVESFAPKSNIDTSAPLQFEHADFSAWEK